MSRSRKAAASAAIVYCQYGLSLVAGLVLFPMVVRTLGSRDNGLWLASVEVVGYLLLGDLGVIAVVPWLVAAKDGAGDRRAIGEYLANGLVIGAVVGLGFVGLAVLVLTVDPTQLRLDPGDWSKLRTPLATLLGLTGIGFPLRAYTALLTGLQDIAFAGVLAAIQSALSIALTATLIPLGFGLTGMALATGVPPLACGVAATLRTWRCHPGLTRGVRPTWDHCRGLIGEGFGAWLAGFGVRLQSAGQSVILVALDRPEWATYLAVTSKTATIAQPMGSALPDSGLVGLNQLYGEGNGERTRRIVACLLLLYVAIAGTTAVGLLAGNPAFVRSWIGADLYGGHRLNALIAANLVAGTAVGGLFRVVGAVAIRRAVGWATLAHGAIGFAAAYGLAVADGLAGIVEGSLAANLLFGLPAGLALVARCHGLGPIELVRTWVGTWAAWTLPFALAAGWLGVRLYAVPLPLATMATIALAAAHLWSLRGVLSAAPWPDPIRRLFRRFPGVSPRPSRIVGPAHAHPDRQQ